MTTDTLIGQLKQKAEDLVKRGQNVREETSRLISEATSKLHQTTDDLTQLVKAVADGASAGEISTKVAAAMVGTFIGIFLCYAVLDPISNMMKQIVKEEMSDMEAVKVVLVSHLSGKPELVSIDAGRRLIQINIKPSFAQLETWVNQLEESPGV